MAEGEERQMPEAYAFEPLLINYQNQFNLNNDGEEDQNQDDNEHRIGNTLWCQCGHCHPMPTARESICCQEIPRILRKLGENFECATLHEFFPRVCLDFYVLDAAILGYVAEANADEDFSPSRFRYVAYRQFVRSIWRRLPAHTRVILPSCVINRIREEYPDEQYVGFKNYNE